MLKSLMFESGIEPQKILDMFAHEARQDGLKKIDPRHLAISLLGMLIFPFIARPIMQMIYFNDDKEVYNQFLSERKEIVKNMVLKIIEA
jgi:hypothetical protein